MEVKEIKPDVITSAESEEVWDLESMAAAKTVVDINEPLNVYKIEE